MPSTAWVWARNGTARLDRVCSLFQVPPRPFRRPRSWQPADTCQAPSQVYLTLAVQSSLSTLVLHRPFRYTPLHFHSSYHHARQAPRSPRTAHAVMAPSISLSFIWTILGFHLNIWLCFSLFPHSVQAYIPASPVNGTDLPPDASGTNGSEASYLNLQWYDGGYQEKISYQLVGATSTGISQVCSPVNPCAITLRSRRFVR